MNKQYGNKYDYMSLPPTLARQITHDEKYIKEGTGKAAIRKIYHNQRYDQFEVDNLKALKLALGDTAPHYDDDLLYRFLYSFKCDVNAAAQGIKAHETWLKDPSTFRLTEVGQQLLDKGILYLGGRDKKYRPSVIIRAGLIDQKKMTVPDFLGALNTVFMIAQQYMFFPGYVENWIIVIDTMEVSILSLPIEMLKQIIGTAAAHYVGNLEKLYLLNPSGTLNFSWRVISAFIDERSNKKIQFLEKKQFSKMLEYFDPSQLEQQYGGTMTNVTQYWPPVSTIQQPAQQPQVEVEQSVKSLSKPYQQQYESYQPPFKRQPLEPQQASYVQPQVPQKQSYTQSKYQINESQQFVQPQLNSLKLSKEISFQPNNQQQFQNSLKRSIQIDQNYLKQDNPMPSTFQYNPPTTNTYNSPITNSYNASNNYNAININTNTYNPNFTTYTPPNANKFNPETSSIQSKSIKPPIISRKSDNSFQRPEFSNGINSKDETFQHISFQDHQSLYNQNYIEPQSYERKSAVNQPYEPSQQSNRAKPVEFNPPYPEVVPQGPVVFNNTEQNTVAAQQKPEVQVSRRQLCIQARDGKYTACSIF